MTGCLPRQATMDRPSGGWPEPPAARPCDSRPLTVAFGNHPFLTISDPPSRPTKLRIIRATVAEGILAHPTGGAFACALARDCGESTVVTDSDGTARCSHAEPPGATERKHLTLDASHPPPTLPPEVSPW